MSCSTIHLFLGILCIFNIILYKSINLESSSIVEKFDIVSLQSQINLVKTQIASMKTSILEQNKILKAAMDKYFEEQSQKNTDEYKFQLEQDQLNHRLLSDMELNLSNLESQLKSEIQSPSQSQDIVFDLDFVKNTDNINLIINEINKFLEEGKFNINDLRPQLNELQKKYDLSKTVEDKNELDIAIASINTVEYLFNSINSYKLKFQSLLAIDKTDENIKKILAPTHYPIAKLDPNFKNNESIYNQQIIVLETIIKQYNEAKFTMGNQLNEYINQLDKILITKQNSSDPNEQKEIDDTLSMLNGMKSKKEILKIYYESLHKCLEYTKQMIYLGNNPQPTRTSASTVPAIRTSAPTVPSRTSTTTVPPTRTSTTTVPPQRTTAPTVPPRRNAPIGQSQYDIVLDIDDKINPIYPPPLTQIPDAYNSVSKKQMNNTTFVSDYKSGPNEKVFIDKLPLYYFDVKEEELKECCTPSPSSSPSPDLVKELKYDNTKNGSMIINCMVVVIVFCIMMLITTLLLPYLIDNQFIISIIISIINIAIIITIFILTYYLFNNNVKDTNNMSNINNYKYNGMTMMGYLVVMMALIIFFVCGVPNMFLLFNPDQSNQSQYTQSS
jgi:hypothetical protein